MTETIPARFELLDERFRDCRGDRRMEVLHTGCRWTEGPAYFPAGRYLVFGGAQRNHVFICATTSVYALRLTVTGARYP